MTTPAKVPPTTTTSTSGVGAYSPASQSTFRTCQVTGRRIHDRAEPVIKANAVTAIVFLLVGTIAGQPPEPVAWTFEHFGHGKTFFTPLGHPEDFVNPAFQRLLLNGIRWAAGLPVAENAR